MMVSKASSNALGAKLTNDERPYDITGDFIGDVTILVATFAWYWCVCKHALGLVTSDDWALDYGSGCALLLDALVAEDLSVLGDLGLLLQPLARRGEAVGLLSAHLQLDYQPVPEVVEVGHLGGVSTHVEMRLVDYRVQRFLDLSEWWNAQFIHTGVTP